MRISQKLKLNSMLVQALVAFVPSVMAILHVPGQIQGANGAVHFQHISDTTEKTLITVRSILQDEQGFFWLGSSDGLVRYDGYTFKVYKKVPEDPNSLSHNEINVLYRDKADVLWIGTEKGGLNRFNQNYSTFTRYMHEAGNFRSLPHNNVSAILEDHLGNLWVGTVGGGLSKFDREMENFTHYQREAGNPRSLSDNDVLCLFEDRSGVLWVGIDSPLKGGLNKFDRKTETFTHYQKDPDNPYSLSDNSVTVIHEDRSGILWVGTRSGGLNRFDRKTETFTHFKNDPGNPFNIGDSYIRSIFEHNSGDLWIGTYTRGLNRISPEKGTVITYRENHEPGFSDNPLWAIYEDSVGTLWLGSEDGGFIKFIPDRPAFEIWTHDSDNPNSLNESDVRSIYEGNDGTVWIGTYSQGLNRYDRKTETFTHYRNEPDNPLSLSGNRVLQIVEDRDGMLWIGAYKDGLNKFDKETETFTRFNYDPNDTSSLSHDRIRSMFIDRSDILWVGTRDGLNKFDRKTETFIRYQNKVNDSNSLSENNVRVIYEDKSGIFWLGTDSGLNRFDLETETFTRFLNEEGNPHSLGYNSVRSIKEDKFGNLWIGTRGGLDKFDRDTGTFTHYTEKDGLPNDIIFGILEDDAGNLYLSTPRGLAKFNPQREIFHIFTVREGLTVNAFEYGSHHHGKSGLMYFGAINGLAVLHPDELKKNKHVPPVVITDFKIFNQPVKLNQRITATTEIELSYRENYITLEFAALDFVDPVKNQYAYKMEGLDPDWIYSGTKNTASYTYLKPGKYLFRVKGSNNDGYWNDEGASLTVTIIPPFWATGGFRVSAFLAVIIIIILIHHWLTGNIRRRQTQLEIINEQLNKQIVQRKRAEEEKKKFEVQLRQQQKLEAIGTLAGGVAHEINNPINGIMNYAQLISDRLDPESPLREFADEIGKETERVAEIVRNLLAFARQDKESHSFASIADIVNDTVSLIHTVIRRDQVALEVDVPDDLPKIKCRSQQIQQVLMNLLTNARDSLNERYPEYDPDKIMTVTVRPFEKEGRPWVRTTVEDHGAGIPDEIRGRLFDPFFTTKDRTEGTGLGLSISHGIVQDHRGEMSVECEAGRYTRFHLDLQVDNTWEVK